MNVKYPLEQVLAIKKDRVARAEKVVKDKQKIVNTEEERLKKVESERDVVNGHYKAKITQLRNALDEGTTGEEVLKMKAYIKVVKENLEEEEKKVAKQKEVLLAAKRELQKAQIEYKRRRIEVEKTELHKKEWMKEALLAEERQEAKDQDEMGQLLFQIRKSKPIN